MDTLDTTIVHSRYILQGINLAKSFENVSRQKKTKTKCIQSQNWTNESYLRSGWFCSLCRFLSHRISYLLSSHLSGLYFAKHSSKSNQYVFGNNTGTCNKHDEQLCERCRRYDQLYRQFTSGFDFCSLW